MPDKDARNRAKIAGYGDAPKPAGKKTPAKKEADDE